MSWAESFFHRFLAAGGDTLVFAFRHPFPSAGRIQDSFFFFFHDCIIPPILPRKCLMTVAFRVIAELERGAASVYPLFPKGFFFFFNNLSFASVVRRSPASPPQEMLWSPTGLRFCTFPPLTHSVRDRRCHLPRFFVSQSLPLTSVIARPRTRWSPSPPDAVDFSFREPRNAFVELSADSSCPLSFSIGPQPPLFYLLSSFLRSLFVVCGPYPSFFSPLRTDASPRR